MATKLTAATPNPQSGADTGATTTIEIDVARHFQARQLKDGEKPKDGVVTTELNDGSLAVSELTGDESTVTHVIEAETVERMIADAAAAGKGTSRERMIADHVEAVTDVHHAPADHWTAIRVSGDKKLESYLRRRLLDKGE